ncbi:MAG TPA: lyase family protein, partial [Blastocatellia bacterium]|nr:lyase family protein [Blastocatellia bacterium]
MALWGGRFEGEANASFAKFNSSFSFDKRLLDADIEGSLAHVEGLKAAGILTPDEGAKIEQGLKQIQERSHSEPQFIHESDAEDVHSFV